MQNKSFNILRGSQMNSSLVQIFSILLIIFCLSGNIVLAGDPLLLAETGRTRISFDLDWKFFRGEIMNGEKINLDKILTQSLDLPHDWSIEGPFDQNCPDGKAIGFLPGGIGWYYKAFNIPKNIQGKRVVIEFDGAYMNSAVWLNKTNLGTHPYGYTPFQYDITPYLKYGKTKNILAVRINVQQPCSRWYSGAGIYRHVWLTITESIHISQNGIYITTPKASEEKALISIRTKVQNETSKDESITLETGIEDAQGRQIAVVKSSEKINADDQQIFNQEIIVSRPNLWSPDTPYLYKAVSKIKINNKIIDEYTTPIGIRTFQFDPDKGFILNNKNIKIKGVCMHHDLGSLGSAVNTRAIERQLEILKSMGCNALRTSHNPPAPKALDLCDKLGFLVMVEAFDEWKKNKTHFGYGRFFDEWAEKDLVSMIRRDWNHPSIILWSIGNEIPEQKQENCNEIVKMLVDICHREDPARPVTAGCNQFKNNIPSTNFTKHLDVIGYNYAHGQYKLAPEKFPNRPIIASETSSAVSTRGIYHFPPIVEPKEKKLKPDIQCSSYDVVSPDWGCPAETSLKALKNNPFIAGEFVWTGFDYLGEPTPYSWPARSSYFGIVDLAGFPKDRFFLYQSQWSDKPMVHILPHWNWEGMEGQIIPVWCYSNCDEVELFLNGKSLGIQSFKSTTNLHLSWDVPYTPGKLKAVAKKSNKIICSKEVITSEEPAKIEISADRQTIKADGSDLSFITVIIKDKNGNFVPLADNLISFKIEGSGVLAGTDNGNPISLEDFKGDTRKAFNGLCLAVVKSTRTKGKITVTASSKGLDPSKLTIITK